METEHLASGLISGALTGLGSIVMTWWMGRHHNKREERKDALSEMQKWNRDLQDRVAKAEEKGDQHEKKIDSLKKELQECRDKHDDTERAHKKLGVELQECREKHEASDAKYEKLQKDFNDLKNQVNNSQEKK